MCNIINLLGCYVASKYTMTRSTSSKLNPLLTSWPAGAVYTTAWLKKHGYSYPLVDGYRKSAWVFSLGKGAVARCGDKITCLGGIYALQQQANLDLHVGGSTALQMLGVSHFLELGGSKVQIFARTGVRLPSWFKHYKWKAKLGYYTTNLFSGAAKDLGLREYNTGSFSIKISSRERAIMEVLELAPKKESLENAKLLMEGLNNLRPELIQKLLQSCSSIKVKRLFLAFADLLRLPWFKKLNIETLDLGHGKRNLTKNGKLYSKYLITLPAQLLDENYT